MKKQAPKVGQEIYIIPGSHYWTRLTEKKTGYLEKVSRVGNKYFYIGEGYDERKFLIDDWVGCDGSYSYFPRAFESKAAYDAYEEEQVLRDKLFSLLNDSNARYHANNLSIEKVKTMIALLGSKEE